MANLSSEQSLNSVEGCLGRVTTLHNTPQDILCPLQNKSYSGVTVVKWEGTRWGFSAIYSSLAHLAVHCIGK